VAGMLWDEQKGARQVEMLEEDMEELLKACEGKLPSRRMAEAVWARLREREFEPNAGDSRGGES